MRGLPPRRPSGRRFSFHKEMTTMNNKPSEPSWLELKKKVSVKRAAEIAGISEDSFRRHFAHLIRKITPRRDVVELGDALSIGGEKRGAA
jgi:hypothetical protein